MSNQANLTQAKPAITIVNGKAVTSSLTIATLFGKRHTHILRNIETLIADAKAIKPEYPYSSSNFMQSKTQFDAGNSIEPNFGLNEYGRFTKLNFELSEYTDSIGRKLPAYNITRDGFTLLAMGFTGQKALQFKLAYIEAFNKMEQQIAQQSQNDYRPSSLLSRRWLVTFEDGKEVVTEIPKDAAIMTPDRLLAAIARNDVRLSTDMLSIFITSAALTLATRAGHPQTLESTQAALAKR